MQTDSDSIIEKHLARVARPETCTIDPTEEVPAKASGYPGSKAAGGVAERIIGQMAPHLVYVEAFAGHAAVFRLKRAAERSILIDADADCCEWLRSNIGERAGAEVVHQDAIKFLELIRWSVKPDWLIYLDPPYLRSVRTGKLYAVELLSEAEHTKLLEAILTLNCMVMISGYESWLYDSLLADWRRVDIPAMTRGGKRVERLWCNFDVPELLHDVRFAGGDYRERENFARRGRRWAAKFKAMSRRERQLVAAELAVCDRQAVEAALFTLPKLSREPGVTDQAAVEVPKKGRRKA